MSKRRSQPRSPTPPESPTLDHETSRNAPPLEAKVPRSRQAAFYIAVFLSSFLLFQVQPMIGKAILPWYGGSPAVWTTSMLFFQVLLLAGYCGAHLVSHYLLPKLQWGLYLAAIVIAVALLPIHPADEWKPVGNDQPPIGHILAVLGRSVGLPFLLLSANTPLLQVWWYRVVQQSPYRLYALSNAGSLSGLVTYPFLIETQLGLQRQSIVWSCAFVGMGILMLICGWFARAAGCAALISQAPRLDDMPLGWRRYAVWTILSATGSVLLLAMTNHLSQNVAVVPLLWVAPLTLYLLSFIVAFAGARWYRRGVTAVVMAISMTACAVWYNFDIVGNVVILLTIHLIALFAGCMLCHGELARLKPAAHRLTSFYVTLSFGGAIGGTFVCLVAPQIFLRYYEYPLAMVACWLVMIVAYMSDPEDRLYRGRPIWAWALMLGVFTLFLVQLQSGVIRRTASSLLTSRDFYGVLTVRRTLGEDLVHDWFELSHGTVVHGAQYLVEAKQYEPTTYYVKESGLGYVMRHVAGRPQKRIGLVGLGVGTVAAYGEPGDDFRAYEIDPNVIRIATDPRLFSFWARLEERGATARIVPGDARISLERELDRGQQQSFNVLVLDAFSGDAVPVHLLTREAFNVYFQHLAPDGIIAVHISNSHLNLLPVVRAIAATHDADLAAVVDPGRSDWILMSRKGSLDEIIRANPRQVIPVNVAGAQVLWTDDYSNIFGILK